MLDSAPGARCRATSASMPYSWDSGHLRGPAPPPPHPSSGPHERRHHHGGREAVPAVARRLGVDEVAALQRCPIEDLAGHARLRIPEGDARLLGPVVREQVRKAVVVHILRMAALRVRGRSSTRAEGERRHVHVRHVKGFRAEYRDWDIRNMEVYAAMIDSMDQGIGRLVDALKETGRFDNTLICFFQDNGGCAENYGRGGIGGPRADQPEMPRLPDDYLQPDMTPKQNRAGYKMRTGKGSMAGPDDTAIGYGRGWATVSNTPFREYKHWVHEGGISTPLIAHWPARIPRKGELEKTPGHLIDLMATAVDVSGAKYPLTYHDGQKIKPMEGKSLLSAFEGKGIDREAIYWEHEGNRAIRVGDWKLVRNARGRASEDWQLFFLPEDIGESRDLAYQHPERLAELKQAWQQLNDEMIDPIWAPGKRP